jgi:hypothetical protein
MKNKPYSVTGDKDNGFRIAVRTDTGVRAGDRYDFEYFDKGCMKHLPEGSLVYVPAPRPTASARKRA